MFTLPYISDFLTMLLVMIAAGVVLIFPATYFGGKIGAALSVSALTGLSCFVLMYGKALGKSFSNSNSPVTIDTDMLITFLGIALLYSLISFIAFCLRQVTHGVGSYTIPLVICSVILVGFPMYLYATQAYDDYRVKVKNYSSMITIAHPKEFPILIDQIRFFDSKTEKSSYLYSRFYEKDRIVSRFEGISDENDSLQSHRYYTKMVKSLLPLTFDTFELSWYSPLDNRFYKDVFPIDQANLKIDQSYEGQMTISDLLVTILPDGNVDLLKKEYSENTHLGSFFKVEYTDVAGKSFEEITELFTPIGLPEDRAAAYKRAFDNLKRGTTEGYSAEEILSFRKVATYGIDVTISQKEGEVNELQEIDIVDFYLNRYNRSAKFLRKIHRRALPRVITIKVLNDNDKRNWIHVIFDKKQLLDQYTAFEDKHKNEVSGNNLSNDDVLKDDTLGDEVSFVVGIDLGDYDSSLIALKSGDDTVPLTGWIIGDNR